MSSQKSKDITEQKRFIVSLMDLTSLNDDDNNQKIEALCKKADTPFGLPAALCIYSQFLPLANKKLIEQNIRSQVRLATVANFPKGGSDVTRAAFEVEKCVALGADEVDVVFPYRALLEGNAEIGEKLIRESRKKCAGKKLKVILETGELKKADLIEKAAEIAIAEGADFIKTSTGKVLVNATLSSARIMLNTIAKQNKACGFKAAGGVRNAAQAEEYLSLATEIMGKDWVTPQHFRFGTSSLLDSLLQSAGETLAQNIDKPKKSIGEY